MEGLDFLTTRKKDRFLGWFLLDTWEKVVFGDGFGISKLERRYSRKPLPISIENTLERLDTHAQKLVLLNVIRSHKHEIFTEEINKVALSGNDDKRIIMEDRIQTLAYGHYSLRSLRQE